MDQERIPSKKDVSFLKRLPKGIEYHDSDFREFAIESGEVISVKQFAAKHEDGWYIHMPDGNAQKVGDRYADLARKPFYMIYMPGNDPSVGTSPMGIEVGYEPDRQA